MGEYTLDYSGGVPLGICLIIPVGITKETVSSTLSLSSIDGRVSCLVAVTVRGLEDVKREILEGLREASHATGFDYFEFWVDERRVEEFAGKLLNVLLEHRPSRVVLSLISGSRYLIPLLYQVLLYYWGLSGVVPFVLHGVEGGSWRLEPLPGFVTISLPRSQRRVFLQIYSHPGDELRTVEDLIERYSYGRSVYKVLNELERKGLISWRKNRILKTTPGRILFKLMRVGENGVSSV